MTGEDERTGAGAGEELAARYAAIVRQSVDLAQAQSRRWRDRGAEGEPWSAEQVAGDVADLFEHLTPIAEQSINLMLDVLRPFAQAMAPRLAAEPKPPGDEA